MGKNKIKISIMEKFEIKKGISFVEKVSVSEKIFHLMFDKNKEENLYKVYIISEKLYKDILKDIFLLDKPDDYIGDMPIDSNEIEWMYSIQKKHKVFGKKDIRARLWDMSFIGVTLFGIILLAIGIWKIEYKKILIEKEETTIGTVYDYSTVILRGRYMEGYYKIYVTYTVDGKTYKVYGGKTTNIPSVGNTVTVCYDPDRPGKVIDYDRLWESAIQCIITGGSLAVVGGTMCFTNIQGRKF